LETIINKSKLELMRGNIAEQDTDAIVNSARSDLGPDSGVAGAIHRAAGPGLWEEVQRLNGCTTGEAKITAGHNLKAKYVIHTVGPVFGNTTNDSMILASSYEQCLRLASQYKIESISFPSISTGIFGYPVEEASEIALRTVINYLTRHPEIKLVRFVLLSQKDYKTYEATLQYLLKKVK